MRGLRRLPSRTELRMPEGPKAGSQSMWAKLCAREGNSPDRPLRPPSHRRVAKDVRPRRQPGGWLRSSHPFKECVTAHWSSGHAPTIHGAKRCAEAAECDSITLVGERPAPGRSRRATDGGPRGSENAGMSSERRARDSSAVNPRFPGQGQSSQGQSGAKARPRGVAEAQQADIPAPGEDRHDRRGDGLG